jgi:hypothetical protein
MYITANYQQRTVTGYRGEQVNEAGNQAGLAGRCTALKIIINRSDR